MIAADDPGAFGYSGLSLDFWAALLAFKLVGFIYATLHTTLYCTVYYAILHFIYTLYCTTYYTTLYIGYEEPKDTGVQLPPLQCSVEHRGEREHDQTLEQSMGHVCGEGVSSRGCR